MIARILIRNICDNEELNEILCKIEREYEVDTELEETYEEE